MAKYLFRPRTSKSLKFSPKVVKRRSFSSESPKTVSDQKETPKNSPEKSKCKNFRTNFRKNSPKRIKAENESKKTIIIKTPTKNSSKKEAKNCKRKVTSGFDSPPAKDGLVWESPQADFQPWTPKSVRKSYSGKMKSRGTPKYKCVSPNGKKQKVCQEFEEKQNFIKKCKDFPTDIESYSILELIGRGSFFDVYTARSLKSKKLFALKKSQNKLSTRSQFNHFKNETEIVQEISPHTNILPIHAAWLQSSEVYYITPLMHFTLKDWPCGNSIAADLFTVEALEEGVWKILHDASSALDRIHNKGYIHIDVKPDNILVHRPKPPQKRFGNNAIKAENTPQLFLDRFVLNDFGQARKTLEQEKGAMELGEWRYRPPEVLKVTASLRNDDESFVEVKPDYDVYSLGMVVLDILMGTILPYEALDRIRNGDLSSFLEETKWSEDLKKLVGRMLSNVPKERPLAGEIKTFCAKKLNIRSV